MSSSRISTPFTVIGNQDNGTRAGLKNGLVWAIRARPGEDPTPLAPDEIEAILDDATPPSNWPRQAESWAWLHFDTVHSAARAHVGELPCLPPDVRSMLAETEYGIMLEALPGLVWGAMPAFDDGMEDDRDICAWRFAMRPDLLITTRRNPIPVLGAAYRSLRADSIPRSPAGVIDRALREFTGSIRRQIGQLDDELDRAEDALLLIEHRTDLGHLGGIVGKVRRRATELRRVVTPIDRVLKDDELELPSWAEDELRDRTERQVHAALDDLIALQDRARSLQDELGSSQAEETNRRLYIVSVATTLMLPATFVTGFFGMNTGGMFLAQGAWGTIAAGAVCGIAMLLTGVFLKLARLL
ncbi:magnesium/cobalt transporter CorA [Neoasaia chiangmaiensis NBRC 101099]|uniref:Magnesium transporter n=1 Tax=Neoasaia chiangmaiensis TaxID=320497 RepID=A0A1U9KUS1_9PROT|nr:CorA family divalent cation transporter [Neoasaia chiangmaiensis]AQS89553.1 magnesium transporter [Neoasaia chiangmaiensis]GBR40640.1 magnesium/cobalt transporter CorA [Neoasaia chiangmaiensis NBRC 101099]GEN13805.1 transporter [Neoasaia chiangmaiensis]